MQTQTLPVQIQGGAAAANAARGSNNAAMNFGSTEQFQQSLAQAKDRQASAALTPETARPVQQSKAAEAPAPHTAKPAEGPAKTEHAQDKRADGTESAAQGKDAADGADAAAQAGAAKAEAATAQGPAKASSSKTDTADADAAQAAASAAADAAAEEAAADVTPVADMLAMMASFHLPVQASSQAASVSASDSVEASASAAATNAADTQSADAALALATSATPSALPVAATKEQQSARPVAAAAALPEAGLALPVAGLGQQKQAAKVQDSAALDAAAPQVEASYDAAAAQAAAALAASAAAARSGAAKVQTGPAQQQTIENPSALQSNSKADSGDALSLAKSALAQAAAAASTDIKSAKPAAPTQAGARFASLKELAGSKETKVETSARASARADLDPAQASSKDASGASPLLAAQAKPAGQPSAVEGVQAKASQAEPDTAAFSLPVRGSAPQGASTREGANSFSTTLGVQAARGAAAAAAPQQAAGERLAARVGTQEWTQQLGNKVIFMSANGEQTATLNLNPPELGPMQVTVNISNDQASATFSAAQPEVRAALESALPKLREMMSESGVTLGNATVNTGLPDQQQQQQQAQAHGQSGQGSRGQDGQDSRSASGSGSAPGSGTAEEAIARAARRPLRSGAPGNVDTFA